MANETSITFEDKVDFLDSATGAGLRVLPLGDGGTDAGKVARDGQWARFGQGDLPDYEELEEMLRPTPNANVGFLTGKCSGIIVANADGAEAVADFEAGRVLLPVSPVTVATPSGKHFYYRWSASAQGRVEEWAGKLASKALQGADGAWAWRVTLHGDGSYVTGPCSAGATGTPYRAEPDADQFCFSLEKLPEVERLVEPADNPAPATTTATGTAAAPMELTAHVATVREVSPDGRTLAGSRFSLACRRLLEISQDEVEAPFARLDGSDFSFTFSAPVGEFKEEIVGGMEVRPLTDADAPTSREALQLARWLVATARGEKLDEPYGVTLLRKYGTLTLPPKTETDGFRRAYVEAQKAEAAKDARLILARAGIPTSPWRLTDGGTYDDGTPKTGKGPACAHGWESSTCNEDAIEGSEATVIGVPLGGDALPDGSRAPRLLVLDLDRHDCDGVKTWANCLKKYGVEMERSLSEKTQSGGYHVFLPYPSEFDALNIRRKTGLLPGVDWLGHGGVAIIAPSYGVSPATHKMESYKLLHDAPLCRSRTLLRLLLELYENAKKVKPSADNISLLSAAPAQASTSATPATSAGPTPRKGNLADVDLSTVDSVTTVRLIDPSAPRTEEEQARLDARARAKLDAKVAEFRDAGVGEQNTTLASVVCSVARIAWSSPSVLDMEAVRACFQAAATANGYLNSPADALEQFKKQFDCAWSKGQSIPNYELRERGGVSSAGAAGNPATPDAPTSEPFEFDPDAVTLEEYPLWALGTDGQKWVNTIVKTKQAHHVLVATELLGIMAGCAQEHFDVYADAIYGATPISLYALSVAGTSEGKSLTRKALSVGLCRYDDIADEKYQEDMKSFKVALARYHGEMRKFEKGTLKGDEPTEPPYPIDGQFVLSDGTVEGWIKALQNHRHSVLILNDEAAQIFKGYSMTSEQRARALGYWCSLWSGQGVDVRLSGKEKEGETIKLRDRRISWALSTQPNMLEEFLRGDMKISGLMPRVLLAIAPAVEDKICPLRLKVDMSPLFDFHNKSQMLLSVKTPRRPDGGRQQLTLDAGAEEIFIKAYDKLEAEKKEKAADGAAEFRGKMLENATRIAAVLTTWEKDIVGDGVPKEKYTIDAATFERGLTLARWYCRQWESLICDGVKGQVEEDAKVVMDVLQSNKLELDPKVGYRVRKIKRACGGRFSSKGGTDRVRAAGDLLCRQGYLAVSSTSRSWVDGKPVDISTGYFVLSRD